MEIQEPFHRPGQDRGIPVCVGGDSVEHDGVRVDVALVTDVARAIQFLAARIGHLHVQPHLSDFDQAGGQVVPGRLVVHFDSQLYYRSRRSILGHLQFQTGRTLQEHLGHFRVFLVAQQFTQDGIAADEMVAVDMVASWAFVRSSARTWNLLQ